RSDHALVRAVPARDPLEDVVERADRTADQRAGLGEQLTLGPVDVRPVRHDQNRIGTEGGQVALEQERDLARVRGPCEQAQRHRAIVVATWDDSNWQASRFRRAYGQSPHAL